MSLSNLLNQFLSDMQITNQALIDSAVAMISPNQSRYEKVSAELSPTMPWQLVGALHYRESNCDFTTHLANGDPLSADTVHVPKNLMAPLDPPYTWEEAALAALKYEFGGWGIDPLKFTWDFQGCCRFATDWNGWGDIQQGFDDAYIFNGTNQYRGGDYKTDGNYDPYYEDKNAGVAPILKTFGLN